MSGGVAITSFFMTAEGDFLERRRASKASLRGVCMKITNLLPGTWRVGNDTMIASI